LDEAITPVAVSSDFTTNGNTLTYTISPALPAGLSMSSAGSITGTPTAASTSSSYTVTGQDEYGRDTDSTLSLEVVADVGFDPADLFGVGDKGCYYDITDVSTMRQNSDGTGSVGTGDPVGWLEDLSGNGNHATQSTSDSRPTWNGSGLVFDGFDDHLITPSIDLSGTDAVTVAHANISLTPGSNRRIFEQKSAVQGQIIAFIGPSGRIFYGFGGSSAAFDSPTNDLVDGDPFYSVVRADISAPILKIDSSLGDESVANSQGTGNFTDNALYISSATSGGINAAQTLVAFLFIGRYITDTETSDVETLFSSKSGI
jgi:hypothetical protein